MSGWREVTVTNLASPDRWSLNGGPFGSKLVSAMYTETGVPVIRGSNLPFEQRFSDENFVFVSPDKAQELRAHSAEPGDIIITQRGTLGQVGVIPLTARFPLYIISQSQMKLKIDPTIADPIFIYYYFKSPSANAKFVGLASTSGVPHVNLQTLRDFSITLPPLSTQRSIASILGAYDDLIEVNRRRIAALEEIARGLFDEWFVHFRFHGHKAVPILDTPDGPLPKDWKWTALGELCFGKKGIQTGPFGSQLHQEDYAQEGVPLVMPKNIIDLRIQTDGIARIPNDLAQGLSRHLMEEGDIVYGRRGDIGRRAYISKNEAGFFCGTGCLRLRPDQNLIAPRYLFLALGTAETEGAIKARATGATMPNLSAGAMKDVPVLVPHRTIQREFDAVVEPIQSLAGKLIFANRMLATSRDLLLPRLISGQLSVAEAERKLEEAA